MKRILLSGIFIGAFIVIGTVVAILYANGYRIDFSGNGTGNVKFIEGTGLLVATSKPDGARVLIDGHLTTATNNTINLAPGEYDVEIQKDGYLPWKKKITIKNGLVSEANSLLFPAAPKLEAMTTIGINKVVIDSTNSLLAYTVASVSATKNGIYLLNMNAQRFVFLGTAGTQLVSDVTALFSASELSFSPDGKQILARLPSATYLLNSGNGNQTPQDVTTTLTFVERDFELQKKDLDDKLRASLPRALRPVALKHFAAMKPSPIGDRILYTASISAELPIVLTKKVPSVNSTPEERKLTAGNMYVYDIKEDKNYLIFDSSALKTPQKPPTFLWHPDSRHLIYAEDGKVKIEEYDAGNKTTVFDGPFLDSLVFPWPDGSSIAIVSRLSQEVPYNIYRIVLQ
jgi:hypothetical protein